MKRGSNCSLVPVTPNSRQRDSKNSRASEPQNLPALGWQSATELRLFYSKGGSGLTFEVQQTPLLAAPAWSHTGISAELYEAASGLFYQSLPVAPGESAKFLRLRITQP